MSDTNSVIKPASGWVVRPEVMLGGDTVVIHEASGFTAVTGAQYQLVFDSHLLAELFRAPTTPDSAALPDVVGLSRDTDPNPEGKIPVLDDLGRSFGTYSYLHENLDPTVEAARNPDGYERLTLDMRDPNSHPLADISHVGSECDVAITGISNVSGSLLDAEMSLADLLVKVLFQNNLRLNPVRSVEMYRSLFEAELKKMRIRSSAVPLAVDFLIMISASLDRVVAEVPNTDEERNELTMLEPEELPRLYVEYELDKVRVPFSSLESKALGRHAGPGHVIAHVRDVCKTYRDALVEARAKLYRLPRVLELHTFEIYNDSRDGAAIDWSVVKDVVNLFPVPAVVNPPSLVEASFLRQDVQHLATVISGGSARSPLRRISKAELTARQTFFAERSNKQEGRPYIWASLRANITALGKRTALFEDFADVGSRASSKLGSPGVDYLRPLPASSVQAFDDYVAGSASDIASFHEHVMAMAQDLGPTAGLVCSMSRKQLHRVALCSCDGLIVRQSAAFTTNEAAIDGSPPVMLYRGLLRADAPVQYAGGVPASESSPVETTNGAFILAFAAKAASGPASASWVYRDDLTAELGANSLLRVRSGLKIPSYPVTRAVAVAVPSGLRPRLDGDLLMYDSQESKTIQVMVADLARVPAVPQIRVLLNRALNASLAPLVYEMLALNERRGGRSDFASFADAPVETVLENWATRSVIAGAIRTAIGRGKERIYPIVAQTIDDTNELLQARARAQARIAVNVFSAVPAFGAGIYMMQRTMQGPTIARAIAKRVHIGLRTLGQRPEGY